MGVDSRTGAHQIPGPYAAIRAALPASHLGVAEIRVDRDIVGPWACSTYSAATRRSRKRGLSESFHEEAPLEQEAPQQSAATNDWHLPKNPFSGGGDEHEESKPTASQRAYKEHQEYEHSEGPMRDRELKRGEGELKEGEQTTKVMRHAAFKYRIKQEDITHPKFHEADEREMTKTQVYQSISQQRPSCRNRSSE